MNHTAFARRAAFALALPVCAVSAASAGTLTTLYTFTGLADGGSPAGPLHLDSSGRLFGVAQLGGANKNGVVFSLAPAAAGAPWTETVLYSFTRNHTAYAYPSGDLIADPTGALYGTTAGSTGGVVYRLAPPTGAGAWRYTTLFSFAGPSSPNGSAPAGGLRMDSFGDLIGLTASGGDQSGQYPCQCGVAFSLTPPANGGAWQQHLLHTFMPIPDGNIPSGPLTMDSAGTLYGLTYAGGTGKCLDGSSVYVVGCGTVFALTPSASGFTETVIHEFLNTTQPFSLTVGPDGALYGTDLLNIYRLARHADGTWHEAVLYTFPGGIAGTAPASGLIFDPQGNIYGTTYPFGINGQGTVYKLSPPAAGPQAWTETTLAIITPDFSHGNAVGGLVRGPDGTLYGALSPYNGGGNNQQGSIYAVTP